MVRTGKLAPELLGAQFEIEGLDLAARGHQVVDSYRLQVEKIEQDLLVLGRQEVASFQHQGAQLLQAQLGGALCGAAPRQPQQPQQRAGEQVDEPHQRIDEPQQRRQDIAGRESDALGVGGADHLRRDLAEHQQEEGHGRGGDGDRPLVLSQHPECDHRAERGCGGVGEVVAEQDHAEQLVGALQELRGEDGAAVAGLGQVLQPVAVERHHAGFGDGEERGEEAGERRRRAAA